ncbi:hypothetical protein C8Q70DRAFT_1109043 [Cubamyces menziesii]|uniref:Uncharacterized protein n=1 Tax=Trametes cubensis TaxID=1111947 RepID=A0AAD7U226_9APHY|nr:hypothetical protein C8Q70DRAFT_1109043 [Cubamyces menziesii]KAJ8490054.1 hypothetical protein ONZ51_g2521 [Trametes cubensis]
MNDQGSSPSPPQYLQVVSMTSSKSLLLSYTSTDTTVLLPRSLSGVPSALEPGVSTVNGPGSIDSWSLYEAVSEGPQTIQRLVLRKRTTSPYQIKLPLMTDRLCVRRSASPRTPEVRPPVSMEESVLESVRDVQPPPPNRATLSPYNLPGFHPEAQFRSGDMPQHHAVNPPLSTHASKHDIALDNASTLVPGSTIPTSDTWSEICEDLCRAMEVFAILSEVAPARFFSEATDLPQDSSQMLLATASATSTSCLASSLDLGPRSFDATNVLAGPWSSFVFPPHVA